MTTTPTCRDSSVALELNTKAVCRYRKQGSLFRFVNTERPVSAANEVQSLEIHNSSFSNFLYEMGSLIRLPQRKDQNENQQDTLPFKLQVHKSTFQGLQICGSIISNDYPIFKNETDYMLLISNGQQHLITEHFTKEDTQSIPAISNSDLFSIDFTENTLQYINSLQQTNQKLFSQKVPQEM